MQKVAVAVLNYNGKAFLKTFLPKLVEHSPESSVWIIDNKSEDDSLEYVKKNYPDVKLIENKVNGGFSKGYNDGLKKIEAEYYVLVNSDIEVSKDWINPIIRFMDQNRSVAACQPKIKSYHKRDYFEYAGASGGFIDWLGYPFCRGRIFNTLEEDKGQYDDNSKIFWASGACFFIRSSVYRELGGLDEIYFAHMEEIDLCWRIHRAGYEVYAIPESEVWHVGGGTLNSESPFKTFLNFRNSLYTLYKNSDPKKLTKTLVFRLFLDLAAILSFLIKGRLKQVNAILKANREFYFKNRPTHIDNLPYHFKNQNELIYKSSILWNYYFKGKKIFKNPRQNASS
ncbi:MAG: glycosyltransferase family 2 protein [Bacteroidota bacterium]